MISIVNRLIVLNAALSATDPVAQPIWHKMLSDEIDRTTQAGPMLQELAAVELHVYLGGNHSANQSAFAADLEAIHVRVQATLA